MGTALGITLLTLVLLAGGAIAAPVEEWNRTYSNAEFNDVQQTSDDGYILAGYKSSNESGLIGAYLIKIDTRGNEQWDRILGKDIIVSSLEQTTDRGYILIGSKYIHGDFGSKDFAVAIKTDASGNEEWNRSFDENIDEFNLVLGRFNSVQQTSDSGYILAESATRDSPYGMVIKIDSSGNTEWFRKSNNLQGLLLLQTPDSGYLFAKPGWIIKFDALGNEQWNRTFSIKKEYFIFSMILADDGYILAGSTSSPGRYDALLIKTDVNGNELWVKTFGGMNDDRF
jgi:hypothetical protein